MLLLGVLQAQAAGAGPVVDSDFDLIEQQVLLSTESSVVFDNLDTIAAGYQHLQMRIAARSSFAGISVGVYSRFNADSGSNYNGHYLLGNGSTVTSGTTGTGTWALSGLITANTAAAGNFGATVIDLLDPFETTKNKTTRALGGATEANRIDLHSGLWMNTAAIHTWTVYPDAGSFLADSRFSLYGLKVSA